MTLQLFSYLPKWFIHHHYRNFREKMGHTTVMLVMYFNTTRFKCKHVTKGTRVRKKWVFPK